MFILLKWNPIKEFLTMKTTLISTIKVHKAILRKIWTILNSNGLARLLTLFLSHNLVLKLDADQFYVMLLVPAENARIFFFLNTTLNVSDIFQVI